MNDLSELVLTPIVIIALLLAIFFLAMAYFRHWGAKRARQQQNHNYTPYRMADPYTPPPMPPPPPPVPSPPPLSSELQVPSPPAPSPLEASKVFRQFGQGDVSNEDKTSPSAGYVWE